ncbi:MAG: hypothetical protein C0598_06245 [Marinilabiliales bacterium]|nr:MAG: hypothetical protein C0598_06245 [Marinilabiliales bacterium]
MLIVINFKSTLLIFFVLLSFIGHSQSFVFKGVVKDKSKKQTLAFVNIISNNGIGATTNIDGKFEMTLNDNSKSLKLSYIGYEAKTIEVDRINKTHTIYLNPKIFDLEEVEIFPGINPAHRIIDSVLVHRDENNQKKIKKFSYVSYDKMNITVDADSLMYKDTSELKSNERRMQGFLKKQDIFLLETVTERKYMSPDLNQETVLATRVSGFKDPVVAFMISQLQSTSFYDPQINILNKNYVNPISRGSKNKYFFLIEDTTYSSSGDTIFMISFRPKVKALFDGMKGFLYINQYKWAIQNVKAQPPNDSSGISVKIQQSYQLIDDQWFPNQLNTDITFNGMQVGSDSSAYPLVGKGRSYIRDVNLNPSIKRSQFGYHEVEIEPNATKRKGEFWKEYRVDSLTARELETYRVLDSIGKEANFEKMAATAQTLLIGKIPLWVFDFDLDKIIHYNDYEGLYLGLGLHTNERVSKKVKVGGFWGYGFGDKTAKYGGDLTLKLHKRSESVVKLNYYNTVKESGSVNFFDDKFQSWNADYFYKFFVNRMNKTIGGDISYSFRLRPLRDFKWNISYRYNKKEAFENYNFTSSQFTTPITEFNFSEINLGFRFSFREKVIETTKGQISFGSKYPVVWVNLTKGIADLGGDFNYTRFDIKVKKTHKINYFGEFSWQMEAGIIDGEIPASNLYNTRASFSTFTIFAPNSFATMRINEFLSDKYANLFLTHDFGNLLFKFGNYKPQLLLLTNITFGSLDNKSNHNNYNLKTLNLGFYESGIIIRKLLNLELMDLGLGAMYRYGPYSFNETIDNFAFKISLFYAL